MKKIQIVGHRYDLVMLAVIFLCLLITEYSTEKLFKDEEYYQTHWWPIMLGFLVAAIMLHLINIKISGKDYVENPPDPRQGTFLPIHIKYWPQILPIIGVLFGAYIFFSNK